MTSTRQPQDQKRTGPLASRLARRLLTRRSVVFPLAAALGLMVLPSACGEDEPAKEVTSLPPDGSVDASEDASVPVEDTGVFGEGSVAPAPCVKMDVLFVIDDSASMGEEQESLSKRVATITALLDSFEGKDKALLDYRLGVTTTGRTITETIVLPPGSPQFPPMTYPGVDGQLRQVCTMTRPWLERGDPDLAANFECAVKVGVTGPAYEMPLEATKLALDDRIKDGKNQGFLRDDALLAVVVLTDEDDCSRLSKDITLTPESTECKTTGAGGSSRPVGDYLAIFDALKGGRERWAFTAIAGAAECESELGIAAEAVRLKEFVAAAGSNASFASICDGNIEKAAEGALTSFGVACKASKIW